MSDRLTDAELDDIEERMQIGPDTLYKLSADDIDALLAEVRRLHAAEQTLADLVEAITAAATLTDYPDLDAIEARANAATPGPWRAGTEEFIDYGAVFGRQIEEDGLSRVRCLVDDLSDIPGTAEFIAHARTDVPALVAEVRRLRRWKAEALPILDGLQDLGRALDLPIGERITGPAALDAVERLREQRREALSLANVRVAQWERERHVPAAWAADIRDALEADDA